MKYPNNPMHPLFTAEESIQQQLLEVTPLNDCPTIKEFYAGREIFITGGSGFIGKVLIEKLLRSCPDIKTIYLLLRPKKGKAIEERLRAIVDIPLFDLLRRMSPDFEQKLVAIAGDVAELKLGLSEDDVNRMRNVSIIFHSAASVRFDDTLKHAILMNTRGTREIMEFAEKLDDIRMVMHVSTTYSNVFLHIVEEKIYPAAADWRKTIEICEKLDEDQLRVITEHYIDFMPNTYVFSKNLAEQITNEYKDRLPVVLFRPSVVVSSFFEPLPGWVDNFNGPMGILVASCLGISKSMYGDKNNCLDFIPVDVCVKAMIVAAWKNSCQPTKNLPVYNGAAGEKFKITMKQMLDIGVGICEDLTYQQMVMLPGGGVTMCKSYNLLRVFVFQIIPSLLIDLILKYKSINLRLMKIQRKLYEANTAVTPFFTNEWIFKNDNTFNLCRYLRNEDLKAFEFRRTYFTDYVRTARYVLVGYRRYLLKESDSTLPQSRARYKRLQIVARIIRSMFYLIVFYVVFIKFDLTFVFQKYLGMSK